MTTRPGTTERPAGPPGRSVPGRPRKVAGDTTENLAPIPPGCSVPASAYDVLLTSRRCGWYARTDWHPLIRPQAEREVKSEPEAEAEEGDGVPVEWMFTLEVGRKLAPSERVCGVSVGLWLYHLVWSVVRPQSGIRNPKPYLIKPSSWAVTPVASRRHPVTSISGVQVVMTDHPSPRPHKK